jgi:hypothetical protein
MLAEWANGNDEWIRYVVRQVLSSGRQLTTDEAEQAYQLFREEKSLDPRTEPEMPALTMAASADEADEPLTITKLSNVTGVNALVTGEVIEPHEGLTILFGENGTGKTGYSRIFKALAASRTDDVILGDIEGGPDVTPSADLEYRLGTENKQLAWTGERGVSPFIRMSIFDSPSVTFHVDDDLEYVYVPAALALFNHVIAGLKAVQSKIEDATKELTAGTTTLLSRFPKDATVYPLIETLGAATDLVDLKAKADDDPKIDERLDVLRRAVAALEANTIGAQIGVLQHFQRVLTQATGVTTALAAFDGHAYNDLLARLAGLTRDYTAFREELFAAADLPAPPELTWESFVAAGEDYRAHLDEVDAHDADRCLYCRQTLADPARRLVSKYADYLADKINADISETNNQILAAVAPLKALRSGEVSAFIAEYSERDDKPTFYSPLVQLGSVLADLDIAVQGGTAVGSDLSEQVTPLATTLGDTSAATATHLESLRTQSENRSSALAAKRKELSELIAAGELSKSWATIETQVRNAKEADRLKILVHPIPGLGRSVTSLAKSASDLLINKSFDKLFIEECTALRAPSLKIEFVGRQGRAQRRKMLSGKHKPSKILSEGEQKVLAMADFLAEARLAGITAPVIFDDPVNSLDHRRINEVAQRIAALAEDNQVIVFTHDIFFATTLLSLFEKSKRCTYFHVTDEDGKGEVARATGPRWDSLANLKKNINETIQAAHKEGGEARAALVRTGYDWIRSWCEVFVEIDLLQGVTQRYQPNVRMTSLPNLKTAALPAAIETVTRIFEEACRYIDGHSQPLATLGVSPTLAGLEAHWQELQDARKAYLDAAT